MAIRAVPAGIMKRRIFIALVLIAVTLGAGCLDGLFHPSVVPPTIVPVEGAALDRVPVHTFPFESGEETVRISVDPAVYAGAKEADRKLYLRENLAEEEWIPIYYRAIESEPHQEPFYTDLLTALREIRDREGLDDDRYLELITVFVQSIPYQTDDSVIEPKFPIETYVDVRGDCDDKSLLLAGLLSREDYEVALFYFGEEKHMAVGVRSAECHYQGTSFAYIETTNRSYVGIVPDMLADGTVLSSNPLVITIGNGTRLYTACDEIRVIERALTTSRDRVEELAPEIEEHARELKTARDDLESLEARLKALSRTGNIREYNRLIPEYNAMVRDYNNAVQSHNTLLDEAEAAVELHNHLAARSHDRPGAYFMAREYLSG